MRILVLEPCALHVGYLGCYGNDWVATPNLDRLAAEGIVFDEHFVDCPELSFTTGLLQRSAGSGRYSWPGVATSGTAAEHGTITLPGDIRCRHAQTRTFEEFGAASTIVRSWQQEDSPVLWIEGPSLVPPWSLASDLLSVYSERDDEDEEEESLEPWPDPPLGRTLLSPDDIVRLEDTYAAVVTYWDALLGNLIDELRNSGQLDDLIICVTARAGLPLGEHGAIGLTAPELHEELVHVPLVWRLPHAAEGGLRIPALTQPADLVPTLGELLGIPVSDVQGKSLRPLILGREEQIRPYACAALRLGAEEQWLLRTPDWALHHSASSAGDLRGPRLFVKPDDRWEVNDVSARQREIVERLEAALRRFGQAVLQPGLAYPPLE